MSNPNGFRGRHTIATAVVGCCGVAILDDGSIWLCFVGPESKLEPIMIKPARRISL